ncbi:MAG: peptidoglycan-binding protein, partial [Nitrosopumilus sp.]|nr:peptidoglycan-binding protein [Nitrosopumilus sp.]
NSGGTGYGSDQTFTTSEDDEETVTPTPTPELTQRSRTTTSSSVDSRYVSLSNPTNIPPLVPCKAGDLFNSQTGIKCPLISNTISTSTNLSFTQNLELGMIHLEVTLLQKYLNNSGFTVSQIGAGSKGNETDFFGRLTQTALSAFQKTKGIVPAVGYFGPITRAFIQSH